ncbi:hypothetical protein EUTSA_v10002406mg [Eutrema salsugineum]|uniref:F-box/LRR-repeat protein 15-like leucin rich repeat domain-containing protein n=1 Tax=Eutrema salsugineum TaxID=72664 RepID=V4LBA6_EUTSA|nr:uncharacterized protein LOC18014082 [Eutrema salsugineum]ESQ37023.1 hypothetical protein EUTSA_v10002406mg [Eutrema salsugineum]
MTILRSREIPSISGKPFPKRRSDISQPSTPARTQEPNVHRSPVEPEHEGSDPVDGPTNTSRRRSPLLAYKCGDDGDESLNGFSEKEVSVDERFLSLRSGKRVAKRCVDNGLYEVEISGDKVLQEGKSGSESKRKRVCVDLVEEDDIMSNKSDNNEAYAVANGDIMGDTVRRMIIEEEGKTVIEDRSDNENHAQVLLVESQNKGKGIMEDSYIGSDVQVNCVEMPSSSMGRRKYTMEEKGKGIQLESVSPPRITNEVTGVGVEEKMELENSVSNQKPPEASETELPAPVNAAQTQIHHNGGEIGNASRFRNFAEKHASRFARFDAGMEEDEELSDEEVEQQVEDWPGPFSTAMKIMKDREENTILYNEARISRERSSSVIWAPRKNHSVVPPTAPSLQELSLRILVKNADAITSLDYVPDALRVKLCQLLCDSRRMDVHFLNLLVRGTPTEISVPDCSWLTEEEFTECFKNCDTSNLMVLQLDMCGRCMPDYVLPSTLARSPENLPMLSSLSLIGACRLSDVGLRTLVSAAPAIKSINLSQCSLLTSSSIDILSDSLGSVLRELYINECQNIDLKLALSALKKFEKLEVLSFVDLPSVRGRFLREFVSARGQALKQLILTNSVKLTDSCVKDISENCPNLSVLDLANARKLTDSALGHLANGCQALEKLIFCRNSFSDEGVAAFVETAGGSLKELSLNNCKKVGHNTAAALAKHSGKLQILDVSWCRDISDDSFGYIVDNCLSLKVLKVFGCTQITDVFVRGHSNPNVKIIGLKMDPFLDHLTKKTC